MNLSNFWLLVLVGIISRLPAGLLCCCLFMAAVLVSDRVVRGMPNWPPSWLCAVPGHMPCIAAMLHTRTFMSYADFTFA